VVFREVKCVHEFLPKEHEKIEYSLNEEESYTTTKEE